MWDWITGAVSRVGEFIGGIPSVFHPSRYDPFTDLEPYGPFLLPPWGIPAIPAVTGSLNTGAPAVSQVTPGLEVFEGETIDVDISPAGDPGLATFEPDPLEPRRLAILDPAPEPQEEPEIVPIHGRILGAAAPLIGAIATGAAFGVGNVIVDALGGDGQFGTSVAPPEPATTPGVLNGNGIGVFETPARPAHCGSRNGAPTIAQIRGMILQSIGARHGRCSFSYSVARRILRDLGEVSGAGCLGITKDQACFLLIHPPKRRGRQITPKQINRAMGALKRVRSLNKSIRKTVGPGFKL